MTLDPAPLTTSLPASVTLTPDQQRQIQARLAELSSAVTEQALTLLNAHRLLALQLSEFQSQVVTLDLNNPDDAERLWLSLSANTLQTCQAIECAGLALERSCYLRGTLLALMQVAVVEVE